MKRIIYLIFALVALFPITSYSQSYQTQIFDFSENKDALGMNIGYSVINFKNYGDYRKYGGIEFSVNYYGVYFDLGMPLGGNHQRSVEIKRWNDEYKGSELHVGYIIPIVSTKQEYRQSYSVRLIPNVGYVNLENGWTDGSNWTITSNGISNKFNADHKRTEFDYGMVVSLKLKSLTLNGKLNRYTQAITLGFEMKFD